MGDQMEAFEVTDYDLESEFNPHARRGFRQTREEQIYGVFADDSGDEKAGPSKPKRKPNYMAPLGFVKGGVHQVGKDAKPVKKSDDEDDGDGPPPGSSDEEDEAAPRVGAGLPRTFGSAPKQRRFQAAAGPSREEIAGMRSAAGGGPTVGLGDIGHWEKYTKGIGAKLLKQMGFREGGGLGKNLQGISTPVEAKLRKGRGAIGAYGTEKPASRPIPAGEKPSDEPEREFKEKLGQWRRGPRRKKVDYVYKTLDEVLQEGKTRTLKSGASASSGDLARTKVIDMTGREQRVLSGYHAIHGQRAPPDAADDGDDEKKAFDMPELLHNINLMVDICEQDIIRSDRALRYERDRQVTLEHEEGQLSETIERQKAQTERVEEVSRAVAYMEKHKPGSASPSPLDTVTKLFVKLKTDYPLEYDVFDLDYLAVDYVFPLVRDHLKLWSPLRNPKFATDVFAELKEALEGSDKPQMEQGVPVDVYHRLLWELWMPPVRSAIILWQPKQQPELTQLLELWRPLLPRWVLENVCDQLLMPRLQTEVDAWNPLTDAVPIHSWIHPWMPIMDQRLEGVYPTIRHKLANALLAWHPSDRSARLILAPWVGVMAPGSLEAFLVKNILPKLQLAMSELVINPHQQVLDQWNWVIDWEDLISPVHLVSILDKLFFPKWLQVLVTWLNHAPNYEEITKWYIGWKQLIPERLVGHAVVRDHLNTGLQLMNRAASNPGQSVSYQELSQLLARDSPPPPPPPPAPTPTQIRNREDLSAAVRTASGSVTLGFRDLLERRCEERGILLHPLPGKFHEGKPVFRCGGLSIYLDRSVIFVSDGGVWVPSSLQSVLDKAAITGGTV